ncbi:DNA replication/repair protein RecF [Oceanispirochaeta sp.]|uniref:DNA replication/repair protein RecF n=1 Tax=Oceanispirochaeta sp. TaxID=2035350 RepID=UPI0026372F2D|nr:DNA replication and repair protein RecF [Oceanispirochaeta sp.]MDA3957446.1 DNA replication and repair protein RecF [Oceanispirochaeta sp.]
MGFTSVKLKNFRNLEEQEIDLSHKEVYLIGENGQGKTNFLELLYFLCYASSFRNRSDKVLIREGESSFYLSGQFLHSSDLISNRLDVFLDLHNKKIKLNGKSISDRKDILSNMPCVVFCHNDIYFVNGSPDKKRIYMDQCLSLHDPLYINDLRHFRKILKERNFLLKNADRSMLSVYTSQLIDKGFPIMEKRKKLFQFLNETFSEYYKLVSGTNLNLKIHYNCSWKEDDKDKIFDLMKQKEEKEIQYGLTFTGPHRDSFTVMNNNKNFNDFASTGQLRIISLLLRVLQSEYYQKESGRNPILLVDDVLLELDKEKRERMMSLFPLYEQIFYTFLPGYENEVGEESLCFRVKEGKLEKKHG